MTRTRLLAAAVMAPIAIAAVLLLPTPWMVALGAVLFLAGLWEWFNLAEIDDTLARTMLLVANLLLMDKISPSDVQPILYRFANMDRDNSGVLTQRDVVQHAELEAGAKRA